MIVNIYLFGNYLNIKYIINFYLFGNYLNIKYIINIYLAIIYHSFIQKSNNDFSTSFT